MAQIDRNKLRRSRLKAIVGQETAQQVEHVSKAGAKLIMGGVLVAGDVIPTTTDISAAAYPVLTGSILRIEVAAATYIAFGSDQLGAVSVTTTPALKLPVGVTLVVATDDFIRCSANPTRVEIINDSDII